MHNTIDIFFTGGGTAGHVLPNIFIIKKLLQDNPQLKIGYIGNISGIEKSLISEQPNVEYFGINADKMRRYLSWQHLIAPFKILHGFFQAYQLMKKFKPKVVFAKGGFICVPVVLAAYFCKVKIFVHESDFSVGLANKICFKFADLIGVSFSNTMQNNLSYQNKIQLFGPIFDSMIENLDSEFEPNKQLQLVNQIFPFLNTGETKPILLIMGGSLGARAINEIIYNNYRKLLAKFNLIHLCGNKNLNQDIAQNITNEKLNYYLIESIGHQELLHLIKISNMVISRAGVNSVFELMFLKKLTIFIPLSKQTSRGDQIENATYFTQKNACQMILQEDLHIDLLFKKLEIFNNPELSEKYTASMNQLNLQSSTEEISKQLTQWL